MSISKAYPFMQAKMSSGILNLFVLAAAIVVANAQIDCSKPPKFMSWKSCCKIPKPTFDAYKEQCGKFQLPIGGHNNPCLIDCVVNATNTMNGEKLNLNNARSMLSTIFAANPEFVNPYVLGLQKCETEINEKLTELKAKGRKLEAKQFGLVNCDPLPLVYSMCAAKNVFTNCPKDAWTATEQCEQAKQFALNCERPGKLSKLPQKIMANNNKRGKAFMNF